MLRHSWVPQNYRLVEQLAFRRCRIYEAWKWTTGNPLQSIAQLDTGLNLALAEFASGITLDPSSPYSNPPSRWSNVGGAMLCGRGANGNFGGVYSSPLWHSSAFSLSFVGNGAAIPVNYYFSGTDANLAAAITRAWNAGNRIIVASRYLSSYPLTQTVQACAAVAAGKGLVIGQMTGIGGMLAVGGTLPSDECGSALTWLGEGAYNTQSNYGAYQVAAAEDGRGPFGLENGADHADPITDWAGGDQAVAVAVVGIIAQMIVSVAPGLTSAQIASCITSTLDQANGGWLFSSYFTGSGAGVPNAENAVLMALSLQYPTQVFPYLYLHGSGPAGPLDVYGTEEQDQGIRYILDSQGWQVQAHGTIGLEVGAFKNGVALPVNVILDGQTVASNALTSRILGNLVPITSYRNDYSDVRVVEPASATTRTYAADYASAPALNAVVYAPPQSLSGEADAGAGALA
jgi:hypothetical protein